MINQACELGHLEIVKVLLDAKAPISTNAIYWAASNGHLEIVKVLLDAEAPINTEAMYYTST